MTVRNAVIAYADLSHDHLGNASNRVITLAMNLAFGFLAGWLWSTH